MSNRRSIRPPPPPSPPPPLIGHCRKKHRPLARKTPLWGHRRKKHRLPVKKTPINMYITVWKYTGYRRKKHQSPKTTFLKKRCFYEHSLRSAGKNLHRFNSPSLAWSFYSECFQCQSNLRLPTVRYGNVGGKRAPITAHEHGTCCRLVFSSPTRQDFLASFTSPRLSYI